MPPAAAFAVERDGEVLILTPNTDLSEFAFEQIERDGQGLLESLQRENVKHVVLDFRHTEYYGSTALGFFVKLWKRVCALGGGMAFCNLSAHEKEILEMTMLDTLWDICGTREEAIVAVRAAKPC